MNVCTIGCNRNEDSDYKEYMYYVQIQSITYFRLNVKRCYCFRVLTGCLLEICSLHNYIMAVLGLDWSDLCVF